ncbi:hypothetical protein ACQQ2N_02405 [Dokdonella sp. MW10]|uniref:hypothetical protein n=1 Tax=Dokdonella sp. MW10 TaxID=2992926 RepID=UPI003F7E6261
MNTRNLTFAFLCAALLAGATGAFAAEFSMGGSGVMVAQGEPSALDDGSLSSAPGMGSGERGVAVGDLGSQRYVRGAESPGQSEATLRDDDHAEPAATTLPSAGPRAVIPAATPGVPAKPRNTNRWQSLVPGAIK